MLGLLSQWKTLIQGHFHGQRQSRFMMIHDQQLICGVLGGSRAGYQLSDFFVVALAAVDLQQEHAG